MEALVATRFQSLVVYVTVTLHIQPLLPLIIRPRYFYLLDYISLSRISKCCYRGKKNKNWTWLQVFVHQNYFLRWQWLTCYDVLYELQTQNVTWCFSVIIILNFWISSNHTRLVITFKLFLSFSRDRFFSNFSKSKCGGKCNPTIKNMKGPIYHTITFS